MDCKTGRAPEINFFCVNWKEALDPRFIADDEALKTTKHTRLAPHPYACNPSSLASTLVVAIETSNRSPDSAPENAVDVTVEEGEIPMLGRFNVTAVDDPVLTWRAVMSASKLSTEL